MKSFLDNLTRGRLVLFMLCIGLVQVACYYVIGMMASPDGCIAVPQPDTLLYCQAARRIAEGHAFSFSAGAAPCTGTTSVLHPFVLVVPYLCGATGDALLTAGFVMNALFYLAFLACWGVAFSVWLENAGTRLLAGVLLSLSGQVAYCTLAQSDIGLWLAASGVLVLGIALRKRWLYGLMLVLGPWVRPEGMVCVIAFGMVLAAVFLWRRYANPNGAPSVSLTRDGLILALAIASMAGVFLLNIALTGEAQFSSVANKGYFKSEPFASAVRSTAHDFILIIKTYLTGLSHSETFELFAVPLVSGLLILTGIVLFPWRRQTPEGLPFLLLAVFGASVTVAQSGWLGTNMDRYLVWAAPCVLVFLVHGVSFLTARLASWRDGLPFIPVVLVVLYALGAAVACAGQFYISSRSSDVIRQFGAICDEQLPKEASIGGYGGCALVYKLGDRTFRHLSGIYSSEIKLKSVVEAFSVLKNEPELRFDYWLLTPSPTSNVLSDPRNHLCGDNVLTGPAGFSFRKADWTTYDAALRPVIVPEGKDLVARVDVGYGVDERNSDYEVISRYYQYPEQPELYIGDDNGVAMMDVGRVLIGGDAMTVPLRPGQDATVVLRTYARTKLKFKSGYGSGSADIVYENPMRLNVAVDQSELVPVSFTISTNEFSDVTFTIPGSAITQSPSRVSFLGDHIACGYWFFQ